MGCVGTSASESEDMTNTLKATPAAASTLRNMSEQQHPIRHSAEIACPSVFGPSKHQQEQEAQKDSGVEFSKDGKTPSAASTIGRKRESGLARPATGGTDTSDTRKTSRDLPGQPRLLADETKPGFTQATCKWRFDFIPIIETAIVGKSPEERIEFFEGLVAKDKEKFLHVMGTYYGAHPEHIPDREPCEKMARKLEEAQRVPNPRIFTKQHNVFKDWAVDHDPSLFQRPRTFELDERLGPKNERSPEEVPPECKHCQTKARFAKVKKLLSFKKTSKQDTTAPKSSPKHSLLATSGETSRSSLVKDDSTSDSDTDSKPTPRRRGAVGGRESTVQPTAKTAKHLRRGSIDTRSKTSAQAPAAADHARHVEVAA